MPYHVPAKHPALRGLGILALVVAMALAAELARIVVGGYAAGGTRQ